MPALKYQNSTLFVWVIVSLMITTIQSSCGENMPNDDVYAFKTYYLDSNNGSDTNNGLSPYTPWKSLSKIENTKLNAGDTVRFKRASNFEGMLVIVYSGTVDKKITLSDYGSKELPPPSFTNQHFKQGDFGNCIKIKGSNIVVENLLFEHTATFVEGTYTTDGGWKEWEMGALYIDKGVENCHVRNNEFFDCVAGIRSYGTKVLLENNYIHDCNRPLRRWNWGPIGIWLGNDYQEVRYNRIINIRGEDPNYVSEGADGGAMEIDDERYDKTHIFLHHNFTQDCQGFLEIVLNDVISTKAPIYEGFNISYNVCDDYSAFCKIREAKNCTIDNNTVIRRKKNSNEKGIFVFKGNNTQNKVRNNIFVTTTDVPVFTCYNTPAVIIQNNLYYSLGTMMMGNDGPGSSSVTGDPEFVDIVSGNSPADFAVKPESPAIDKGMNIGYTVDFAQHAVPQGNAPDMGAFEIK
ncbi:MAG: choice-of-anchor Q domain-containing protein [Bacteroidales bacterium]